MNAESVKAVMERYKEAWETQNPDLILECFTEDAIYQESPVGKRLEGHDDIRNYWLDQPCSKQKDITFEIGKIYIDDETAFIEWECRLSRPDGRRKFMAGIMILEMSGERISHLNEYWNVKEDMT